MSDAPTVPIGSLRASPSVPTEPVTLLPCPFCGEALVKRGGVNDSARCATLGCYMNQRALVVPLDEPKQVSEWNTRAMIAATQQPAGEGVKALADELEDKADELDMMDARGQVWGLEDVSDLMRRARAALSATQQPVSEGVGDYPDADGTDAAHPAWWRGHEQTAAVFCQKVNEVLDGRDDGRGRSNDPWESTRRRLLYLVQCLRDLVEADTDLARAVNFCEPTARLDQLMLAEGRSRTARNAALAALPVTPNPIGEEKGAGE